MILFLKCDRSFSTAGPRLWNNLPPGLWWPGHSTDSFGVDSNLTYLATEVLSDCQIYSAIQTNLSIYLSVYRYL